MWSVRCARMEVVRAVFWTGRSRGELQSADVSSLALHLTESHFPRHSYRRIDPLRIPYASESLCVFNPNLWIWFLKITLGTSDFLSVKLLSMIGIEKYEIYNRVPQSSFIFPQCFDSATGENWLGAQYGASPLLITVVAYNWYIRVHYLPGSWICYMCYRSAKYVFAAPERGAQR